MKDTTFLGIIITITFIVGFNIGYNFRKSRLVEGVTNPFTSKKLCGNNEQWCGLDLQCVGKDYSPDGGCPVFL